MVFVPQADAANLDDIEASCASAMAAAARAGRRFLQAGESIPAAEHRLLCGTLEAGVTFFMSVLEKLERQKDR